MHCLRLLVQNDFSINADIHGGLKDLGIFVTSAHTAEAAIAAIDQGEYLNILMTDVDLGEGLNGFDVANHARRCYPKLPVVFVSDAMASRYAAEGVAGSQFITKPFRPSQIRDAISRTCGLEAA